MKIVVVVDEIVVVVVEEIHIVFSGFCRFWLRRR
jgi:hypothetical protein